MKLIRILMVTIMAMLVCSVAGCIGLCQHLLGYVAPEGTPTEEKAPAK